MQGPSAYDEQRDDGEKAIRLLQLSTSSFLSGAFA
jgi:hypothetical protein